jgi:hypothetical protein
MKTIVPKPWLSVLLGMASFRLAATMIVRGAVAFSPCFSLCLPPRFDVFGENLVCSWTTPQGNTKLVVEEVMRSCGGAVQGIREVPLLNMNMEMGQQPGGGGGVYLNRANDGFLFLDNGTYTCGPVVVAVDDEERKEKSCQESSFLFNFCISELSRLIVSTDLSTSSCSPSSFGAGVQGILLRKAFGGDCSKDPVPTVDCSSIVDPTSLRVEFSRIIQCSMPSLG